jgi:Domain of unknown function (DUF4150)
LAKPIAINMGIAFAFPDVCLTPAPPSAPVPIPYPNIAQLDQATGITDQDNKEVLIGPGGNYALLMDSEVSTSTGDEAGSSGGVKSGGTKGACKIVMASNTVVYGADQKGLARFGDTTEQNDGNAVGVVLSAFPTVLVGD